MKRALAALALLLLAAVAAWAGSTLACGPYTSSCPGGPWEIVANEPIWPMPSAIWVNDVALTWNPETGKYERWNSDWSGESWEFNPPNEAIHSTWPAVGPPDLPQVGTYSGK